MVGDGVLPTEKYSIFKGKSALHSVQVSSGLLLGWYIARTLNPLYYYYI